jgi:hypothetical protein
MLFDPQQWQKFDANQKISPGPDVSVKLSKPGALFVHVGKNKQLVGYGTEFKFKTKDGLEFSADVAGVVYQRNGASVPRTGPILTNMEKLPEPSALERAVNREMRLIRAERNKLRREALEARKNAERKARAEANPPPETETPEPETETPEGETTTPAE